MYLFSLGVAVIPICVAEEKYSKILRQRLSSFAEPRNWPPGLLGSTQNGSGEKTELLTKKNRRICLKYGGFYGCGGRTRTYDLRVMRGFWVSLSFLNHLKCVELVQVFRRFTGNSEQFPYSPTIVDTPVCMFFDGVLEKVLERNQSVRYRKTRKMQQLFIKIWLKCVKVTE